jgi:hypothetical protein
VISILVVMLAGVVAGVLGALLGVGGAILIIPVLNLGLGLPMFNAATVGLFTVIGTSTSVTTAASARELINVRLALVLLIASVLGALSGVHAIKSFISERTAEIIFGAAALIVAVVMIRRIDTRNIITSGTTDIGRFGGRFHEMESGGVVSYRVRRLPVALSASFIAGAVSSITGVGGGTVIVPALNSWCGVPLRAAATTSAFMIGMTALPGVVGHYQLGHLATPHFAAAAVLGVLAGARGGLWVSRWTKSRALKLLMALLLLLVGMRYLVFGGPQ